MIVMGVICFALGGVFGFFTAALMAAGGSDDE